MNAGLGKIPRLEVLLAALLQYGTWLASGITALGLAMAFFEGLNQFSAGIVMAGIASFIALPVLRVILMLIVFVTERDYRFVAISAIVLMVILMGFALGTHMARH
jgi:uncharacterized membrane protein